MDWSDCEGVEVVPGRLNGRPVIKDTRVAADTVSESAELGRTPEEIASDKPEVGRCESGPGLRCPPFQSRARSLRRVLFDHNVPSPLPRFLWEYEIKLADEVGWATLQNGQLLSAAERAGFEILLSGDQTIKYETEHDRSQDRSGVDVG